MPVTSSAVTHQGLVRTKNEDAFVELTKQRVWVVADGMGGLSEGQFASQKVISIMQQRLSNQDPKHITTQTIMSALQEANTELFAYSEHSLAGAKLGATVAILLLTESHYYFIWAGDSRGYLLRDAQLTQQTRDHSRANQLLDGGTITSAQATSHPSGHEVVRAIGVKSDVQLELCQGQLHRGDAFLLCSDGLNDALSDFEIEKELNSGHSNSAQALVQAVLLRGARDNVSCIVIHND